MPAGLIWAVIVFLVGVIGVAPFVVTQFGLVSSTLVSLLVGALLVGILSYAGLLKQTLNKQSAMWLSVVAVAGLFLFGGANIAIPGLGLASVSPVTTTEAQRAATLTTPTTLDNGCAVPAGVQVGKSATVRFNAYNLESNTPYSAAVADGNVRVYFDGAFAGSPASTSAGTVTAAVGQKGFVTGGNSTFYTEPVEFCVTSETTNVDVLVHNVTNPASLAITCYDSTAATALGSSNANSSVSDYQLAVGANGVVTIFCKQTQQSADASFNLGAIATYATNDMKDVRLTGFHSATGISLDSQQQSATKVPVPSFLRNHQMSGAAGAGNNTVSAANVYRFNKNTLLQEFDEVQYKFEVEGGSTNPANTSVLLTDDEAVICFMDAVWTRGADGKEYDSINTVDQAEGNVGLVEDVDVPRGLDACAVISAT